MYTYACLGITTYSIYYYRYLSVLIIVDIIYDMMMESKHFFCLANNTIDM